MEAQALVTFISDAHALDHAEQLIDLHAGEIIVLDDDSLRVDLSADYRAALVAVGTRFRRADDGRIRWDSVMRLKLVEVSRVEAIRKLSLVRRPELFLPKLKSLCAEVAVAVVLQRAPQGCRASGASRMVASDKAMILLSFRGLSDDRFWFTVFHELGHVVLHRAQTFVDSDIDAEAQDDTEREANDFASRCIIPERREDEFERLWGWRSG